MEIDEKQESLMITDLASLMITDFLLFAQNQGIELSHVFIGDDPQKLEPEEMFSLRDKFCNIQSLEQRIEDHNRVIDLICEIRDCKSYKDRGLKCPDCPTDYGIV